MQRSASKELNKSSTSSKSEKRFQNKNYTNPFFSKGSSENDLQSSSPLNLSNNNKSAENY